MEASAVNAEALEDQLWVLMDTSDSGGAHVHLEGRRAEWFFNSRTRLLTDTKMSEGEAIGTGTWEYKISGTTVNIHDSNGTLHLSATWEVSADGENLTLTRVAPVAQVSTILASTVTGTDLNGNPVSHTIPQHTVEEQATWHFVKRTDG